MQIMQEIMQIVEVILMAFLCLMLARTLRDLYCYLSGRYHQQTGSRD